MIHTGIVSEKELGDLYNLTDLFVFPSLYEGFGLPIIEAMACGTKVASSNTSSPPEVGGDKVSYFDPLNTDNMAEVIEKELLKEEKREDVQKRIDWARSFSWKKTSDEVKSAFTLKKQ